MTLTSKDLKPFIKELKEIKSLLQTILIFDGSRVGLTRDQIRGITHMDTNRVSEILGNIKIKNEK